jgi:hypothetical protein
MRGSRAEARDRHSGVREQSFHCERTAAGSIDRTRIGAALVHHSNRANNTRVFAEMEHRNASLSRESGMGRNRSGRWRDDAGRSAVVEGIIGARDCDPRGLKLSDFHVFSEPVRTDVRGVDRALAVRHDS